MISEDASSMKRSRSLSVMHDERGSHLSIIVQPIIGATPMASKQSQHRGNFLPLSQPNEFSSRQFKFFSDFSYHRSPVQPLSISRCFTFLLHVSRQFQPMLLHIERNASLQAEWNEVTRCWIMNERGTYCRWTAWIMTYDNAFSRDVSITRSHLHQSASRPLLNISVATTLLTCCLLSVEANRTISLYASLKPSNQHFEIIFLLFDSTLPHGINQNAALL